jgi:tetratricopeptide (TPR) repeat protein
MYDESHETFESLHRLFAGHGAPIEAERAAAHLTGCPECRRLASRAIAAQRARGDVLAQGPLRWIVELLEIEQNRLEEWLEAQAAWAELRALSAKSRRDKVRLTRSLHTAGFLEVLLEEAAAAPPAEGEELFYLALLAAAQLPSSRFSPELKNDLCAECCAEMANARRRLAKWTAARDALQKGADYLEKGTRSGLVEGKLLCVAGALEEDLGNSQEAAGILRTAVRRFEAAGETFLKSRTLAQLAYVLIEEDPAESLRIVEQSVAAIPADQPRLRLFAEGIKIDGLLALGAPQEALLRFKALKGLHDQFREPFIQLRRRFSAARILKHLGRLKRAESLFEEVIAGDLEQGFLKDLFLDLAYLLGFHLRRNQPAAAIAVCQRASRELSLLEDEEGSSEPARRQMRQVWQGLEAEVRRGNAELGAPVVLRSYLRAHWRFPATDPPFLRSEAADAQNDKGPEDRVL